MARVGTLSFSFVTVSFSGICQPLNMLFALKGLQLIDIFFLLSLQIQARRETASAQEQKLSRLLFHVHKIVFNYDSIVTLQHIFTNVSFCSLKFQQVREADVFHRVCPSGRLLSNKLCGKRDTLKRIWPLKLLYLV